MAIPLTAELEIDLDKAQRELASTQLRVPVDTRRLDGALKGMRGQMSQGGQMAARLGQAIQISFGQAEKAPGRLAQGFRALETFVGRSARVLRAGGGLVQMGALVGRFLPGLDKYREKLRGVERRAASFNARLETLASTGHRAGGVLGRLRLSGAGAGSGGPSAAAPSPAPAAAPGGASASRWRAFGVAGAALIVAGAAGVLAKGLGEAMDEEQLKVSLDVVVGDSAQATTLIDRLKKDAAATPLTFGDLAGAAKMLVSFGEQADHVPEVLRRIGDVSTAIQAPIGEIAEIYGKARVQGTLFAEDINQLTGRGIPVIQEFAKQLGVSDGEIKKLASEGSVTFPMLERAFQNLTAEGGKFGGMMERMSHTLGGLWSTFQDALTENRKALAAPIADALKPVLEDLIGKAIEMKSKFTDVGKAIGRVITWVHAAFRTLSGGEAMELIGKSLKLGFMEAVDFLARGLQAAMTALSGGDFLTTLGEGIRSIFMGLKDILLKAVEQALRALSNLPVLGENFRQASDNVGRSRAASAESERQRQSAQAEREKGPGFVESFQKAFAGASGVFSKGEKDSLGSDISAILTKVNTEAARLEQKTKDEKQGSNNRQSGDGNGLGAAARGPALAGGLAQAVNLISGRSANQIIADEGKKHTGLLTKIAANTDPNKQKAPQKPKPLRPLAATGGTVKFV